METRHVVSGRTSDHRPREEEDSHGSEGDTEVVRSPCPLRGRGLVPVRVPRDEYKDLSYGFPRKHYFGGTRGGGVGLGGENETEVWDREGDWERCFRDGT